MAISAFSTKFIYLVINKFPRSSHLGILVGFNGASLDFAATKFRETFPDFKTCLR